MVVQTVRFVPFINLGTLPLLGPGLVATLFTNSEPAGVVVVPLTALAALIWPPIHWTLFMLLCALRTIPFLAAALLAVAMRVPSSIVPR